MFYCTSTQNGHKAPTLLLQHDLACFQSNLTNPNVTLY